jgi:hypothetical protein
VYIKKATMEAIVYGVSGDYTDECICIGEDIYFLRVDEEVCGDSYQRLVCFVILSS